MIRVRPALAAVLALALFSASVVISPPAASAATVIGSDLVGSSSTNLASFTNNTGPFTSSADGFGKFQRTVSPQIPSVFRDDSAGTTPGLSLIHI